MSEKHMGRISPAGGGRQLPGAALSPPLPGGRRPPGSDYVGCRAMGDDVWRGQKEGSVVLGRLTLWLLYPV